MRFNWTLTIAAALTLGACGSTPTPPPAAETPKPETVAVPGAAVMPVPPVQAPPAASAPEKAPAEAVKKEVPEDPVQAAEEERRTLAAMTADPDRSVYFPSGGTQVDGPGKAVLHRHALRLKKDPDLVITLIGHTDPLGSRSYNLAIAEERMDSVYEILRSLGIPRSQIRRVTSERDPSASKCRTAACRRLMRRVDLDYAE